MIAFLWFSLGIKTVLKAAVCVAPSKESLFPAANGVSMMSSSHKVIEERSPVMKKRHKVLLFSMLSVIGVIVYFLLNPFLNKTLLRGYFTNYSNHFRPNKLGKDMGQPVHTEEEKWVRHASRKDASSHAAALKVLHPATEPGIMLVQTSDEMNPSPLAICAVESAAKINPDKTVYYFMKGFNMESSEHQYQALTLLSSIKNVVILPLNLEELFSNTDLAEWYKKANPDDEMYWIHVLSDACRIALLWKYGGIYLDTDVISLKPLKFRNFICAQSRNYANGAALGFNRNHFFTRKCIKDYVDNYKGDDWGHQGPDLMSRMLREWCDTDDLDEFLDKECKGILYLSSNWFYPISYADWGKYFERGVWNKSKNNDIENKFSKTNGVHIWNYLSGGHEALIKESQSYLEYFFSNYCPSTYKSLLR
ncbi:lactosylceramide 4-alpha-galactosyltransferase-like isoform X2 [Heterodontus francisci]|uniref:lactosylceramide 4-alpha-galactosyltransferase-like isoform X2 n=1 Tax=Heterodontus francisci TaxID=7792 RepID=UPI00355BC85D